MEYKIQLLRERIINELSQLENGMHIKLDYDPLILDMLLFENLIKSHSFIRGEREYKVIGRTFAFNKDILKKIDFSNVIFDNFNAEGYDFSGLFNVKIDPQKLYNKSLSHAILDGVTFIGSFNDVIIDHANFKGSKGAYINPNSLGIAPYCSQDVFLKGCIFDGVTFTDIIKCENEHKYFYISGANFTGSKNARILLGFFNIDNCTFTDAIIIGNIDEYESYKGVDFTGAQSNKIFDKRIVINPEGKNFINSKLNGVKFQGSFTNTLIDHTDFTGSTNAIIDLRIINKKSDIYSCNFTDTIVIDEFGRKVNISVDGKITNSIDDELDKLLNLEYQTSAIKKEELELQRKRMIEENKNKIKEKLKELLLLVETSEKLGIEPKNLYHSIPIEQDLFLVRIDDHYEINRDIINTDLLRFLNLSLIDFTNVLVSGIDFRNTGARIDPQKVYKKDISGCQFDDENIKFYDDFTNVNSSNAKFGNTLKLVKHK